MYAIVYETTAINLLNSMLKVLHILWGEAKEASLINLFSGTDAKNAEGFHVF